MAYNKILRLFELQDKENKKTFSTQQRKTKRIRRQIRIYKENAKNNRNNKNNENNLGLSISDINLSASYNINFDLNSLQPTLQPTLYNIPYYTNINNSLPTTNAISNSNYTSFNIPQDHGIYKNVAFLLKEYKVFRYKCNRNRYPNVGNRDPIGTLPGQAKSFIIIPCQGSQANKNTPIGDENRYPNVEKRDPIVTLSSDGNRYPNVENRELIVILPDQAKGVVIIPHQGGQANKNTIHETEIG
ncbi:unnamed protein product [Rhizophagus irregularis]|nr:unnamed protein product [Rhizophagus irregularis]